MARCDMHFMKTGECINQNDGIKTTKMRISGQWFNGIVQCFTKFKIPLSKGEHCIDQNNKERDTSSNIL